MKRGSSLDPAARCNGADGRQIKLFVYTLVPMEDTPERLTDKLYWRKARGRVALLREACSGTRIRFALPAPGNHLGAWAANRPARG